MKEIASLGWSLEDAEKCVCLRGVSRPLLLLCELAKLDAEHLQGEMLLWDVLA